MSTSARPPAVVRDRRGRGMRGPLAQDGSPLAMTRAQRFDEIVIGTVEALERRWREQLATVEFAVEDVPSLDDWHHDWVPLARSFPAEGALPPRIVVFRRPIETRVRGLLALRVLVAEVVVEQIAELLDTEPEEVDPRYGRRGRR
ncbi:MAG TPA: metallopeptidase family protein [Jiangellaceae bacterium]